MFQIFFIVLALVGASIHLAVSSHARRSGPAIAGVFLLYLLVIYVGAMGIFTAVFHLAFPARASASIGWAPSPFEWEVGIADLSVGVLGVLCIWLRGNFWLATVIVNAVWFLGDAVGHIRQMVEHHDFAPNNAGIFLLAEIATPLAMLALTFYHRGKAGLIEHSAG